MYLYEISLILGGMVACLLILYFIGRARRKDSGPNSRVRNRETIVAVLGREHKSYH